MIGLSMLVFLFNVVWSLLIKREPAEINPWHAKSIEWTLPTPRAPARLRPDPRV